MFLRLTFVAVLFFLGTDVFSQSKNVEGVTICWDVSSSMQDRLLDREFKLLDDFFNSKSTIDVQIIIFSDDVVDIAEYSVVDSSWDAVRSKLLETNYDGASNFSTVQNHIKYDQCFLFTDGHFNLSDGGLKLPAGGFIVSTISSNKEYLSLMARLNQSRYIDLSFEDSTSEDGRVKSKIVFRGTENIHTYQITLNGKQITADMFTERSLLLNSNIGDTLRITTRNGGQTTKILRENGVHYVDTSSDQTIVLNNVTVVDSQKRADVDLQVAADGLERKANLGYAVQTFDGEDFTPGSTDITTALQGKFSGVQNSSEGDISQSIMRGRNSLLGNEYALIVVDGVPIKQSSSAQGSLPQGQAGGGGPGQDPSSFFASTDFLDPANIHSVTVLKGMAATNRYGTLGNNGVLLITTKTNAFSNGNEEKKDLALLKNNIYDYKVRKVDIPIKRPYLSELKKTKNVGEAYEKYLVQKQSFKQSVDFYVNCFDFFNQFDQRTSKRILSNIAEEFWNDAQALKVLHLKYQEAQFDTSEILILAQRIKELLPKEAQSYLHTAIAQYNHGNVQAAINELQAIIDNTYKEVNMSGIQRVSELLLRNYIHQQRGKLNLTSVAPKYLKNINYDAWVVIDWNDATTEFNLQFVNPSGRFFVWNHDSIISKARISRELEEGFSVEEFQVYGMEKGKWLVNITEVGNQQNRTAHQLPQYVRATVYLNFGKANQKKMTKMIRLHESGQESLLVAFETF